MMLPVNIMQAMACSPISEDTPSPTNTPSAMLMVEASSMPGGAGRNIRPNSLPMSVFSQSIFSLSIPFSLYRRVLSRKPAAKVGLSHKHSIFKTMRFMVLSIREQGETS